MIDVRVRNKVADEAVKALQGRVLGPADYDLRLTGAAYVRMPDGRPLCVYLPGVLRDVVTADMYSILHDLRALRTSNRGAASGTRRLRRGSPGAYSRRSETVPIASTVVGALDPAGQRRYCRLTSWTGKNLPQWEQLQPLLATIAVLLRTYVPDRYAVQMQAAAESNPAWIVPGTPFSTVTVNNSYATGTHTDSGDLDAGFSTIACIRRGQYTGGHLVFPQFRVAADMQDGDLMLMDAHQWHANTQLVCVCGRALNGPCRDCGAERISLVSYYRTKIKDCGDPDTESRRAGQHNTAQLTGDGDE